MRQLELTHPVSNDFMNRLECFSACSKYDVHILVYNIAKTSILHW